jgi:capsular exopolysaccharide synthesis family protein
MSRIEEALRRAAATRKPGDPLTPTDVLADTLRQENVETPVVAAWQFERFPSEHAAAEATEAGAADSDAARGRAPAPDGGSESGVSAFALRTDIREIRTPIAARVAEKLVIMKETSPVSVEQYRKLAASLHQAQLERNIKVVMIASAMSGEGKTLTAVNLALTLSESYRRRVLLVDADLRRPQMHELFQLPNVSGLNEGLKAPELRPLSVFEVSPRLVLLPAGRPDPDPMGILASERMRQVIQEASAAFDWVIMDTPPVVLLPDTNLLADMADVSVLVVAAGKTPHRMVTRAVELLGHERILGVVLNGAEENAIAATAGYARDTKYQPEPTGVSLTR